jgi:hypothetical protein
LVDMRQVCACAGIATAKAATATPSMAPRIPRRARALDWIAIMRLPFSIWIP